MAPIGPRPNPAWTSLIGRGLSAAMSRRASRLSDLGYWSRESGRVQREQLRRLLRLAAGTEIGRAHGYARLASLDDASLLPAYRSEVPIADWLGVRERVLRMRDEGEADVLWPGRVDHFAQTSGTTAGDKYIPVSREMLRSNARAARDIFAHAKRFGVDLARLTRGRSLFLGGSTDLTTNEHGIRTGDLSGIVTPLIRWPISRIYSPGPEIALMSHWPSKIEAMAQATLEQDVRMISGMPSWALVLMERVVSLARARGVAAETIRDVWPNLTLFVHGGVKYAPFDARMRQMYSGNPEGADLPARLELYPASEGFIAMQDERGKPSLRLLVDNWNFFEFVPLGEIDSPSPRALACDEVEKGERYVVVLSTCAGLWRYVLGDVVEFDTIPARLRGGAGEGPPRLRIVGRHRHFMNAFGENIIVENIENAVAEAARRTGLIVGEFTAAPVYPGEGRRPGLELALEVKGEWAGTGVESLREFREAFDASLKSQCVDYSIKRTDDVGMVPPTVTPLPLGTFHRWLESRGKLGGQHKCPRCANSRDVIDAVLASRA